MTGRVEEEGTLEEPSATTNTSPASSSSPSSSTSMPRRQRTTSASTDVSDTGGITPTRRNKRKMTAPKRRSDFSIKRFCPDLSDGRSADEEEEDDDDEEVVVDGLEEFGKNLVRASSRVGRGGTGGGVVGFPHGSMIVVGGSTGSSPDSRRDSPPSSGEDSVMRTASMVGPHSPGGIIPMVSAEGLPMPVVHMNSRMDEGHGELVGERHTSSPPHTMYSPAHLQLNPRHYITNNNRLSSATSGQQQQQHHQQQHQYLQHADNSIHPGASPILGLPLPAHSSQSSSQLPPADDSPSPSNFPIPSPPSPADSTCSMADCGPGGKKTRKNYKNMTRERRVEANARERSRVHTISAAFDSLRRAVPSYSYNQKLSKLAILRIACSYILSLAKLADMDYSDDNRNYSFADCVEMCTRVIQTEGRARRRH